MERTLKAKVYCADALSPGRFPLACFALAASR
jgi:hypothetical protein